MTDHVHDASCAVAHGDAPAPRDEPKTLVAIFASPMSAQLLRYALDLGYRTVLVEPDPTKLGPTNADGAVSTLDAAGLDGNTDVVVCDHHRGELGTLIRDALTAKTRWIGLMGNPHHEGPHVKALRDLGVADDEIARVHRPIGLNIGSRTPAEIAIATLAGLIADRNTRPGGFEF
ncbi:xanthine dehydrogenase accessory factor [Asanoa ishikariensis]|uniref:XdhC Rossmann domain-containing protein n=1 Tax=Asanoa ishikariensis TaxID=137265 RepID=A0A1H3NIA1_9ACTN|nr:XdhC family protein [Asanoa ishikariensis]GIF68633.1 xanthine dehydrogenase accessory factor [Asanoa ishikariensis]SDY87959.1 XdhC Rossmann domain-containing protein [Asanoa ishikariensis]